MNLLQVCSEIFPLLKTGGLADVAAALPVALQAQGHDARVLLPGFDRVLAGVKEPVKVCDIGARGQVPAATLLFGEIPALGGLRAYIVDAPGLYRRAGGPYADAHGHDFGDNHLRFARLAWAAADLALGADPLWRPELVHAHDWHAGLTPACLKATQAPVASVFTIHNLAYQGAFAPWQFGDLGLPQNYFGINGMEAWGALNFMKAGLFFADRITTVSPSYAGEIQQAEQGMGLDGLLRSRSWALHGILNGVDDAVWNPALDEHIPHRYAPGQWAGKALCKAALQRQLGLEQAPAAPLFVVISRLTEQKGLHLVLQVLERWVERGAQFALLGTGDPGMEAAFRHLAERFPAAVGVRIGYDEAFAHQMVAGGDVILVPSRFEPCGLTQLYGLKYGTLPLVRLVGGLADTVTDASLENLDDRSATGFVFDQFDAQALDAAARRAMALYRRPRDWRAVQRTAMARRHDWAVAAEAYLQVYHWALGR